jgi:hypothetical protein
MSINPICVTPDIGIISIDNVLDRAKGDLYEI